MAWKQSAYTKAGAEMLAETLTGRKLTIDEAVTGTEMTEEAELGNATDVLGERRTVGLLSIEDVETEDGGAKRIGIQITNKGVETTGKIHQVGVFGHLDSDGEKKLIFIMQDEPGIEVPSEVENPDFELDLYAVLVISNKANITVNVTAGSRVSLEQVKQLIREHDEDAGAHAVIIGQAIEQAVSQAVAQVSGSIGSAILKEITIPAEGWAWDEDGELSGMGMDEFRMFLDVAVEEAAEEQFPVVALHKEALETARRAGLCPSSKVTAGAVRFWSRNTPDQDMAATLALLSSSGSGTGGGGGTYVLPVATKDRLGGVKLGEGFSTTADGTLSYTGTGLPEDAFASPADTEEMLNEVLPVEGQA